ncbi:hybrid sensor histidine kinase/response regulator, partial [Blautia producta]
GVDAAYPMHNGHKSTGLIAAIPLEYITDFLSLEDDGQLMYYHIIRPDGSFVIQNPNTELWYFFEQLQKQLDAAPNELSVENAIKEFGAALKNHEEYATTFEVNGEERQIYGISLPYSEWYLVSVMPYSILDDAINNLSGQRMFMTLLSCA